jgi:hypothetical protein
LETGLLYDSTGRSSRCLQLSTLGRWLCADTLMTYIATGRSTAHVGDIQPCGMCRIYIYTWIIWRFPKMVVPPNHSFEWDFPV